MKIVRLYINLLVLVIMLLMCVTSVSGAQNISSDVGAYYIEWSWNFTNASVYVDGVLIADNTNLGFYILSNLNPGEKHRVDVYDSANDTIYDSVDMTVMSPHQIFLIVFVIIICVCLGVLISAFPLVGFVPATGLMLYLIQNNFEGWLIIFVALLWILCLLFGAERLSKDFGKYWRDLKRKRK